VRRGADELISKVQISTQEYQKFQIKQAMAGKSVILRYSKILK